MGLSATASQVPICSRTSKMSGLVFENYWQNKAACEDAERAYYMKLSGCKVTGRLSEQIARARDHIKNSLNSVSKYILCMPYAQVTKQASWLLTAVEPF